MNYFLPILALGALCAGWIGLQFLARRVGTKNHFDNPRAGGCCGQCEGGECKAPPSEG